MRRQKIIFCVTNVCRTYIKVCSRHRPDLTANTYQHTPCTHFGHRSKSRHADKACRSACSRPRSTQPALSRTPATHCPQCPSCTGCTAGWPRPPTSRSARKPAAPSPPSRSERNRAHPRSTGRPRTSERATSRQQRRSPPVEL